MPEGPVCVVGDSTRLSQVVSNLLQNSAKFTNPGGRVVLRLDADRNRQRAVIEVEDTGIGIEANLLPRVFDIFTQADQSLDRSRGGLGIGLSMVKGLVELHGGQVSAASAGTGRGATFTFWVPLAVERPATAKAPAARPASALLRVLVIEDNQDTAESLRLVLTMFGHQTEVAHTAQAGVEMARQFHPDVVLCDLGLPGNMNGYDVARTLRQDPATAQIRLIAVSGYGQPEDQVRAIEAGFDLHLTKPVDPNQLQRRLIGNGVPAVSPGKA